MIFGLMANPGKQETAAVCGRIREMMSRRGARVIEGWQPGNERPDLMIVLGGDGTILYIARLIASLDVPVLAVNLGTVGFLTELEVDEIEGFADRLVEGRYRVERRAMLEVEAWREDRLIYRSAALNEAAILKDGISRMIDLGVYLDDSFYANYVADGIICATPTGSTAYSLSAGGPVILPDVDAVLLTPVCPYMLALKPLVVAGDRTVAIMTGSSGQASLTVDGQESVKLQRGDRVCIRKSAQSLKLVKFKKTPFVELLEKKPQRYSCGNFPPGR